MAQERRGIDTDKISETTTAQNDKAASKNAYHYLEVQHACVAKNAEKVVGSLYIATDEYIRPIDIILSHVGHCPV